MTGAPPAPPPHAVKAAQATAAVTTFQSIGAEGSRSGGAEGSLREHGKIAELVALEVLGICVILNN